MATISLHSLARNNQGDELNIAHSISPWEHQKLLYFQITISSIIIVPAAAGIPFLANRKYFNQ